MVIAELPTYRCEPCKDRGWLHWTNDQGEKLSAPCSCRTPEPTADSIKRSMLRAGCMQAEVDAAFTPWDPASRVAKPVELLGWARTAGRGEYPEVWCWTLSGSRGVGKSMASAMALGAFFAAGGREALWVPVGEALERFAVERSTSFVSSTEQAISTAPLVCLEDAGDEAENRTGEVDRWLLARYRRRLPTVVTTNATTEVGMAKLFSARVVSRLHEGRVVVLEGEDYRKKRKGNV